MEKLNDYFLNLLNNPTFNASDFTQVGLSIDNTSIQDKDTYLKSNYIKNLDIFKTNGEFDESKFNNFYDYAKLGFLDLAKIKESDDLGNTWMAYRNDISMPETLRDKQPQFKILKVANPLRQQSGFVNFDLKENPTMSIREIALTLQVYDPETGTWGEAPNDTWFDNFLNPKVLATWDEDGEHKDPITGETVKHKKGDRKLNENGTYYYENLGNRSVYGKEVLSGFDTLTTDGSFWNKLDFLDSDDIEKSTGGTLMRTIAQILPAFIPGVGEWYIGARVGLGLSQVLPAVGKTFESLTGLDFGSSIFNKLEAWDKALTFSQSDYVSGSQTDDGKILSDSHIWSMETGLKLIADVFTQLAEQRWMFEKTSSIFSGLNKEVISSKEALNKWIEDYIAKNTKAENIDKVLMEGISKGVDPRLLLSTMQNVNWLRAQKVLEGKLKGAQELGSKVSMAYMTGITTASAYGEAKQAGASDFEAGLFTLGYTLGEWKLLNSELGKWILPELKSDKRHIKNVIQRAMPKIKDITSKALTNTELGQLKWYLKLFNLGKDAYENNLGKGIASEALGSTVSNMASEALEETSEELLLDLSKTIFNAATSLTGSDAKFNDAFENVFDRYALSFLGGAVGGGIAGYLPAYRSARFDRNMSQQMATKELVDIIQQGKDKELLETAFKMNFGNKYLDENGNQVQNETQSLDYAIKLNFNRLVQDIKDILTVNGANLNKDSLLKELGTLDIRYGMLASLASEESNSIGWYLNRYNDLSSELVSLSLELKKLQETKTDKLQREEDNKEISDREKVLKELIEERKKELDKFKDGTMSDEFIQDALFEMTSKISGVYVPTNPDRWIEEVKGKNIEELSTSEREQLVKEFNDTKPLRRDLIRMARKVHIKNMEWLSKMITDYDETYFKDKDELTKNLEEILSIQRDNLDPNRLVPNIEEYLTIYGDEINPLLYNLLLKILASMDLEKVKPLIDKIQQIVGKKTNLEDILDFKIPTTVDELRGLSKEQKAKLLSELEQDVDLDNIDEDIEEYIGEEVDEKTKEKKETLKTLDTAIKNQNIKNKIDRATEFNKQLITFLSDLNVKGEIINKLKSAKYILPPVKLALIDFFTSPISAKIMDIDGTETELQMRLEDVDDYIKAVESIPSSPVDIYINNVTKTLKSKGIPISPLVSDINALISKLAKARNLQSFSYDDKTEKLINEALQIIEIAKVGLESAATVIQGDLSDAFGFNASINEIRAKRGNKAKPLATIPADVAEGIKIDIEKYERELRMFKAILAYNSNSILNEHDKTYKIESKLLYTRLKDFVGHLELPDWNDLDKLKKEINDPELIEFFENIDDEPITQEFKDKLTKIRLRIDKAVYNFFNKANGKRFRGFKTENDRKNAIKEIQKLLKDVKVLYSNEKDVNTVINLLEKSIPEKDFLWYLASMAAADPEQVLFEYLSVISELFAPIIGQEEAIRTSLSFLIDPKVFALFADAHNANILEEPPLEKGKFDSRPYRVVNAYRSIFIEGVPGSGKSSATLKTLIDILKKYHPDVLSKIVVVSNSKSNSKTLVGNLGFDPESTQHFGIEEFRSKIMNGYKQFDENEDGSLKLTEADVEYDSKRHSYKYKNFTLNADGIDASFIIIDEATSLSQMDTYMLDDFMSAKDIYGVYAGDFDLLGISGSFKTKNSEGKEAFGLITLDITNYISTHKLGQVIRGNNSYKSENTIKFKLAKYDFIAGLKKEENRKDPINFSYYSDESGVYGDVVAKADRKDGKSIVDEGTKTIIENMVNSLNEGEKINYIFDSTESELYKYLHENYADKINEISARAAQSLEGQYYIVDIAVHDKLVNSKATSDEVKGTIEGTNYFKSLYTAMSRAKQATLIYDRGSNADCISKRLNSVRIDKLIKSSLGLDARKRYAESRKSSIKNALETEESKLDLDWKKESFEPENPPTPPVDEPPTPPNDDVTEEETFDDKVDNENEPEKITISNDEDGKLNMMIHTFNANESGGNIDENTGELVLGDRGSRLDPKSGNIIGERIDNANGLVKLKQLGISVDLDGRISAQDTEKILGILHKIRAAGCYGKTNQEIVGLIKDALKLGPSSNVSVNFIYKNSLSDRESILRGVHGALSKFFKSAKEALMYLFNKETDPTKKLKLETNHLRTIGLEIFIDGLQIEVPLGTLTSPATLVETAGFLQLKNIFYQENKNLIKFHQRLKLEKASGNQIPHLDSMLKLLQIYQWNYDGHDSKYLNFVIRLNKNFVLNSKNAKLTGVQTPPKKRGQAYVDLDYFYEGKRVTIEEYKRNFPSRKISAVYENISEGDIIDVNGKVALKKGLPFILVSDFYGPQVSDDDLYKEYLKQISDPNSEPKITRVYVYLPTESIDYFLFNLQEAMKRDESQRASDLDTAIGNKLTTYRLLSFMLLKDSNFSKSFDEWVENTPHLTDGARKHSRRRFERMLELLKYLTDYEGTLTPSDTLGSVSKLMLNFLELSVDDISHDPNHSKIRDILYGSADEGLIGNTKFSIRTILLLEFRKLLFTNLAYEEDIDSSNPGQKPHSPSLSGLDFYITKDGDGNYIYKDYQKERIDALKKDAEANKWTGVMFHSSLEKDSEIVTNVNSKVYKIARINAQAGLYISSKEIEVNGKLDTTAVIMDVEPMLDEILSKLVVTKDGSVCSKEASKYSLLKKEQIYLENTGGFLSGIDRTISEVNHFERVFNECLNKISSDSDNIENIKEELKKYLNDQTLDESSVSSTILAEFANKISGFAALIVGGNKIKFVNIGNSTILSMTKNETYYFNNDDKIIYKASNRLQVTDLEELNEILNNTPNENKAIVTEYINKLYKKNPSEEIDEYWKQQTFDSKEVGEGSRKATLTRPGTSPNTFNGEELNNIRDPQGRRVIGKFYTAQGSEYIISEGGSTRRIKSFHWNTGGEDVGLHNWMKHAFFTENERFGEAAYLFKDAKFEISIIEENGKAILRFKSKKDGAWHTATWGQVYPKSIEKGLMLDGEIIVDISHTPVIGYSLFEYEDDPEHEFRAERVHPGSKVSYIDTMMKSYINDVEVRVERCKLKNKEEIINVVNTTDHGLFIELNPESVITDSHYLEAHPDTRVIIELTERGLDVRAYNKYEEVSIPPNIKKKIINKYIPKELLDYINNREYELEIQALNELSDRMRNENPNVTKDEIIKAQYKLPDKLRDKFGILTINEYTLETNELEGNEPAPLDENKLTLDEVTKKLFGEDQSYGTLTDFITSKGNTLLKRFGGIKESTDGSDKLNIPKTIVFYLASLKKITLNEFKEKINQINTIEDISKIFNLDLNSLKILSKYLMETFKKENDSNIECIQFDI